MQTTIDLCAALKAALPQLSASDRDFASSMISNVERRGEATEKQAFWLQKLLDRANGVAPAERQKTAIGDLGGIMRLFEKARQHLKSPAVVLQGPEDELRISVASERSRAPGTLNVATNRGFEDSTWFGRILLDGNFEASPREPTPPALVDFLKRFACDPAGVAAEHGRLTGKCCFCNKGLTDERSTAVGYGAKCASNFGLPYPTLKEARLANAA